MLSLEDIIVDARIDFSSFTLGQNTSPVESFGNAMLMFHDKRSFCADNGVMRYQLSVVH